MALIVQKFGGTSVANIERIKIVGEIVKKEYDKGNQIVVVVSAMAGITNQLHDYANQVSSLINHDDLAEYDSILSSGEQVTSGLLALELNNLGIKARSMLGWQAGIKTDSSHSKSRIENINSDNFFEYLNQKYVIVVAGFQGITEKNRISTMGRGGSDTSAVAIAASLKANRCDIFTDVDGIYTADPRIVPNARKLNNVGYEETIEMASLGAKVLQTRSVEMAMKHNVPVRVLSAFENKAGTKLIDDDKIMEKRLITAVTHSFNEARVTLNNVPNDPGICANIFKPLADNNINIDMIIQNISNDKKTANVTFTLEDKELKKATTILTKAKKTINYQEIISTDNVSKVSVIGVGMKTHAGIAHKAFKILADKNINILAITTSEIKISVLIERESAELAVRILHEGFDLSK